MQDLIFTSLGTIVSSFALKSILIANHFLDGGITGISLLLHELYGINIALVMVIANIPLLIMGAYHVHKYFAIKSLICIVCQALLIVYFPFPEIHAANQLLMALFGGFFLGVGIGLAMRGGCALDGIEIVALYTLKRSSFTVSEIILGLNVLIFTIAAVSLGLEIAFYATVTYYVASRTINYVIEGLEEFTGVTIVSGKSEEIKSTLVLNMGRGITVYKGERGFMRDNFEHSEPCDIVFTVITRLEVRKLRNVIYKIDPAAFVITNTIKEAAGGILKRRVKH